MTGGRSVLRIEGFKHSNLETGAPDEREAHQPAAPTHARRHERAPVRARYATRVYPCCQEARELLDSTDILALRIGHEPAHVHVFEHALAQRADGLLAHRGLLSRGWSA